jgi:hypothetical protein
LHLEAVREIDTGDTRDRNHVIAQQRAAQRAHLPGRSLRREVGRCLHRDVRLELGDERV